MCTVFYLSVESFQHRPFWLYFLSNKSGFSKLNVSCPIEYETRGAVWLLGKYRTQLTGREATHSPSALCSDSWTLPLPPRSGAEGTSGSSEAMAQNWAPLGWVPIGKYKLRLCCINRRAFMPPTLGCVMFSGWVYTAGGSMAQDMGCRERNIWIEFCFAVCLCMTSTKFSNLSDLSFCTHR